MTKDEYTEHVLVLTYLLYECPILMLKKEFPDGIAGGDWFCIVVNAYKNSLKNHLKKSMSLMNDDVFSLYAKQLEESLDKVFNESLLFDHYKMPSETIN